MRAMPTSICVACDTVAVRVGPGGGLEVLLVRRGNDPFKGRWALPGGFVEEDEDLPEAAARELAEETGLRPVVMDQVGAWGTPGRDPRGRTVSVIYAAVARPGEDTVQGGDDAADAAWHAAGDAPALAFDHGTILPAALAHLRRRCEQTHLAFAFLEGPFDAGTLARPLRALGCPMAEEGAVRLLAASRIRSERRMHPLSAVDFRAPLRQTTVLFPVEET